MIYSRTRARLLRGPESNLLTNPEDIYSNDEKSLSPSSSQVNSPTALRDIFVASRPSGRETEPGGGQVPLLLQPASAGARPYSRGVEIQTNTQMELKRDTAETR